MDESPEFIQSINSAYATDGIVGYWRKRREAWLFEEKHGFGWSSELAVIYAQSGQKDQAFRLLQRADSDHETRIALLNVDGEFDSIRSDPRFEQLKKQLRLPVQ